VPAQFFLHIETRKEIFPSEIIMLQRSNPNVLQISNAGGQSLRLNSLNINEVRIIGLQFGVT
jgi:hypothetical protein